MRLAVIGAGFQAKGIAHVLQKQTDITEVRVGDLDYERAQQLVDDWGDSRFGAYSLDVSEKWDVCNFLKGANAAISTVPYKYNFRLARWALENGCSFCDLGGNNKIVEAELGLHGLAIKKGCSLVPDLGLAPGLVSILTAQTVEDFDVVEKVSLRVGGIPQKPGSLLDYTLTFSIEGLINEYVEDALILENGNIKTLPSLDFFETIVDPRNKNQKLEAFTTSGGISTLPWSFQGVIQHMDYKTIRYPGHGRFFQNAKRLGLLSGEARSAFEKCASKAFQTEEDDVIILIATIWGKQEGRKAVRTYEMVDNAKDGLTAMVRCTGFPATVGFLMMARNQLKEKGVTKVAFDRGGYQYHGRIKALADSLRQGGIEF